MDNPHFHQWSYHCPLDNIDLPVCFAWSHLTPHNLSRLIKLLESLTAPSHVDPTLFIDIITNEPEYYLEHLSFPLQHAIERIDDPFLVRALLYLHGFGPKLLHSPNYYIPRFLLN